MLQEVKREKINIQVDDLFKYNSNLLKWEIRKFSKIEIPGIKVTMSQEEFIEWFMAKLSPIEVDEIYRLIQKAKKRSANIKPILQTIALALADREQLARNKRSFI